MEKTMTIYIPLLEEGKPTLRGTQGVILGEGCYKVLPTPSYDPEDEIWEFPPGSVVRCDLETGYREKKILVAREKV